MKKVSLLIALVSLLLFITGCQKDASSTIGEINISPEVHLKAGYAQTPYFDWENELYINYQGTNILLPWASGANADIPLETKPDFLQSDGWRLLYNTFPLGEEDPMLILYNTYRGILRSYCFVTGTEYTNNMFTWGCGAGTISGIATSAFNYSWDLPSPMNIRKTNPQIFKINWCANPAILPNGIVPGYWYYSEFELAYDSNIPTLTHDQIELQIRGFASERQSISITGLTSGDMKGTFDIPKSSSSGGLLSSFADFPFFSTDTSRTDSTKVSIFFKADADSILAGKVAKQLNSTLKNLLTTGLNSLIGGNLTLSNPILKIISSSIFSPAQSSTTGNINLTLSARTTSSGTISSTYPGPSKSFIFPSTQQTNKGGFLPYYNHNLGVWNINHTPVIKYGNATIQTNPRTRKQTINQQYTFDTTSFDVIINPIISNIENAAIISIKRELIFYPKNPFITYVNGELLNSEEYNYSYKPYNTALTVAYYGPYLGKPTSYNFATLFGFFRARVTIALKPTGYAEDIILVKEFPVTYQAR